MKAVDVFLCYVKNPIMIIVPDLRVNLLSWVFYTKLQNVSLLFGVRRTTKTIEPIHWCSKCDVKVPMNRFYWPKCFIQDPSTIVLIECFMFASYTHCIRWFIVHFTYAQFYCRSLKDRKVQKLQISLIISECNNNRRLAEINGYEWRKNSLQWRKNSLVSLDCVQ